MSSNVITFVMIVNVMTFVSNAHPKASGHSQHNSGRSPGELEECPPDLTSLKGCFIKVGDVVDLIWTLKTYSTCTLEWEVVPTLQVGTSAHLLDDTACQFFNFQIISWGWGRKFPAVAHLNEFGEQGIVWVTHP